jgi:hypothetical protein
VFSLTALFSRIEFFLALFLIFKMFLNFVVVGMVAFLAGVSAGPSRNIASANWPVHQRMVEKLGQHPKVRSAGTARRGHPANKLRAQTTTEFVNFLIYQDSECGTLDEQITYGTGVCVSISDANNGASSFMYSFVNSSYLEELFFSDAACTDLIEEVVQMDFSAFGEENTCSSFGDASLKYFASDSVSSFPNIDGIYQQ